MHTLQICPAGITPPKKLNRCFQRLNEIGPLPTEAAIGFGITAKVAVSGCARVDRLVTGL